MKIVSHILVSNSYISEKRAPSDIHGSQILFIRGLYYQFIHLPINRQRDWLPRQQSPQFVSYAIQNPFWRMWDIFVGSSLQVFFGVLVDCFIIWIWSEKNLSLPFFL